MVLDICKMLSLRSVKFYLKYCCFLNYVWNLRTIFISLGQLKFCNRSTVGCSSLNINMDDIYSRLNNGVGFFFFPKICSLQLLLYRNFAFIIPGFNLPDSCRVNIHFSFCPVHSKLRTQFGLTKVSKPNRSQTEQLVFSSSP